MKHKVQLIEFFPSRFFLLAKLAIYSKEKTPDEYKEYILFEGSPVGTRIELIEFINKHNYYGLALYNRFTKETTLINNKNEFIMKIKDT